MARRSLATMSKLIMRANVTWLGDHLLVHPFARCLSSRPRAACSALEGSSEILPPPDRDGASSLQSSTPPNKDVSTKRQATIVAGA
jgi:hypothetical protein